MTMTAPLAVVNETLNRHFPSEMELSATTADEPSELSVIEIVEAAQRALEGGAPVNYWLTVELGDATCTNRWRVSDPGLMAQVWSQTSPMPSPPRLALSPGLLLGCGLRPISSAERAPEPKRPDWVNEIRRLSGLTWEQLADVLGVTRRTLHNWSNGLPMSRSHEQRLAQTRSVLRAIDRGSASENRATLLAPTPDGETLLDLLSREDYKSVLTQAGTISTAPQAKARRSVGVPSATPLPPAIAANAREDSVHKTPSRPSRRVPRSQLTKNERT